MNFQVLLDGYYDGEDINEYRAQRQRMTLTIRSRTLDTAKAGQVVAFRMMRSGIETSEMLDTKLRLD